MLNRFAKFTTVASLALFATLSPLYPAYASETTPIAVRAASLDPGEFVWEPTNSPSGDVTVVVSLSLQKAFVYRGDGLIGVSTISSGSAGHETPTGSFEILQKRREHYSNKYDNAPMPFMQRLTWEGVALHAGRIPGYPASHGCIRLPNAFARHLFEVTKLGAAVHIVDRPLSEDEALAIATNNVRVGAPVELASGLD
jgi:hypothetical protein